MLVVNNLSSNKSIKHVVQNHFLISFGFRWRRRLCGAQWKKEVKHSKPSPFGRKKLNFS
jgi:hypothetical protein